MTTTVLEQPTVTFADAYERVDSYLVAMTGREIVSTAEVQDVLLDVRLFLDALRDLHAPEEALVAEAEAVSNKVTYEEL